MIIKSYVFVPTYVERFARLDGVVLDEVVLARTQSFQ